MPLTAALRAVGWLEGRFGERWVLGPNCVMQWISTRWARPTSAALGLQTPLVLVLAIFRSHRNSDRKARAGLLLRVRPLSCAIHPSGPSTAGCAGTGTWWGWR